MRSRVGIGLCNCWSWYVGNMTTYREIHLHVWVITEKTGFWLSRKKIWPHWEKLATALGLLDVDELVESNAQVILFIWFQFGSSVSKKPQADLERILKKEKALYLSISENFQNQPAFWGGKITSSSRIYISQSFMDLLPFWEELVINDLWTPKIIWTLILKTV